MEPKNDEHDIIKVLLAESSPAQLEQLRLLLEGHGFSVIVAANGKEALAAARRHKPTLIVSDIVMPELDGYGLCQAIKLDNQLKDVPVILLTALADPQDILLGLESGADNFIHKPYDAEFLLSLLSRIDYVLMNLNLHGKRQAGAEISFGGQRHFITSDRQRILDLLISTHEQFAHSKDKLNAEIAKRKEQELKVAHLSRVYAVLSGIDTTIIRASSQQRLFEDVCRIVVEQGKFRMAWIGLFDPNGMDVTAVATAGFDEGYLNAMQFIVRDDAPDSGKMVSLVLREKATVVCNDIATDPWMTQWRDEALRRGYRSMAAFPLQTRNKVVGLLMLYAAKTDFFDTEEIKLLTGVAEDVSFALDHLEKEEQLNYLAYHDALTGLPNRTLLRDRLDQRIVAARHDLKMFAVVMLNLERFRNVNETLGQCAGDDLLRQVAQRLQGTLNETDILSRRDADSFAIVTGYCDDDSSVGHILERVLSCIHKRAFEIDGNELRIAMQAGVAIFPIDGGDADALCRNAEAALGKAKLSGDRYLFYTRELNARVAEKLTLENKLRRALECGQMTLYYQPKTNLRKQRISGLEALMRWNDPDIGLVLPQKFIPILEETGLILEAGRWALEQAMADSKRWKASGLRVPRIAVNVSALQLRQKNFVATVERTLNGSKDMADVLEIEITESLIMQDVEANIRKLQAVREMGVKIAVDDFGTGYSSLTYIARLPIHVLKIDQAFIMNMTTNPDDLNIVSTIISLGHSLHLKIVAEGVETREQADLLRQLKCDEFQGHLISPAVSAEQIEALLTEKKTAHG